MIKISKSVHIEVAHRFAGHPIEGNSRVHGHSLKVTVTAERDEALVNGMVMDFSCFDTQVETIAGMLDHRYLNDVRDLGPPTLENIAEYLGVRMSVVAPLRTVSVKVERPSLGRQPNGHREVKNIYEMQVRAQCPVNPDVTDLYTFTIESEEIIQVEKIIAFFQSNTKKAFQEDLTHQCASALGARVTSTGWHSGIKVTSSSP